MTVWAHRSSTEAKYVYDTQKNSYQIWLDAPGRYESCDVYDTLDVTNQVTFTQRGFEISKKPLVVEYGEGFENHNIDEYLDGITIKGDDSSGEKSPGPIPTWRITIDVEAHDIVQALAEAYSGNSARIERVG